MNYLKSKSWWDKAGTRAIKTVAQTAIATIGTAAFMRDVNWVQLISGVALAGILSLLTSLAGLPELKDETTEAEETAESEEE